MYIKTHRHHLSDALVDVNIHIRRDGTLDFSTKHSATDVYSNMIRIHPFSYRHGESNDYSLSVVCIGHNPYGFSFGYGIIQQLLNGF